jgi:hypothetical protein
MAYRDDLEAAHARIAALEAQLAGVGVSAGELATMLARCDDLAAELTRTRRQLDELRTKQDRFVESLRAASGDMPTVSEHNRRTPPGEYAMSGRPAGVRCPMCLLLFGESVEMRIGGRLLMVCKQDDQMGGIDNTVRCPQCDHLDQMVG